MKNLLTTIFVLSFLQISFSQNIEWSDNVKFFDWAHLATTNSRGEFIIGGNSDVNSYDPPGFFVLDSLGNLITKKFFDGMLFEVGVIEDMIELENGDFLILGNGGLCDVCCWGSIQRYDADWNPYWNWQDEIELSANPKKMTVDPNNFVYILTEDNKVEIVDLIDGEIVLTILLTEYLFNDLAYYNSDTILLVGQGLHCLAGDIFPTLEDYFLTQIEILSDSTFLTLNDSNLYIVNDTFGISDSINFSNQKIVDLAFDENFITVLIQDDDSLRIQIFNHDLEIKQNFPVDETGIEVNAIAFGNNKILIAGTEESQNQSMFGKTYSFEGKTFDYGTDIGISNIEFGIQPYVKEFTSWGGKKIRMENLTFTVYNYGNAVIENLRINADFGSVPSHCPLNQTYFRNYENIQLNPGESIILSQNKIDFWTMDDVTDLYEFCFWTSIPNNKIDRDHSNDKSCEEIIINDIDESFFENDFEIFPNPAQDELKIELPEGTSPDLIQIFDVYGKLVFEEKNEFNLLNISELNRGAYFIRISESGRIFSSKFLKI